MHLHTKDAAQPAVPLPIVAEVIRGEICESYHCGAAVEVDASGQVLSSIGDRDFVTTMRSAAKPIQAIPMLELALKAGLELCDEELAICCSSHPGEPRHAALAASVLALSGFLPDHLVCGDWGSPPSPLKNGCSGNHAAILLAAKLMGAPLQGYNLPEHPVQKRILELIKEFAGLGAVRIAIDGCCIPTFGFELHRMAAAFARMAAPNAPWGRLISSMAAYPELIGCDDWPDVRLMRATAGHIIAKTGAEGLLCLADRESGRGMAIKIADGSTRALGVVSVAFLRQRGWLTDNEAFGEELRQFIDPPIVGPDGRVQSVIRARL